MACNGICFWTRVSETPEKGRKKDRQESEGKEGWVMDETYHPICCFFLKDSFFLPFPPFSCLWSNYLLQWYSRLVAQEKDSPVHLSQPLQISGPLWEGERKKGSKKEGCTLKSGAVVTQEREGGGDSPVTFLIALYSPLTEWWGSQAVSLLLEGVTCVFLCVYVYSSHVLGQWFTRRESSHCGALCPLRL